MVIEEALVQQLEDSVGVGAQIADRIYPNIIPEDATLPALAYQKISGPRMLAHDGKLYARVRFQMTARAASYGAAKAAINAVKLELEAFTGTLGGAGGVKTYEISIENELDGYNQIAGYATVRLDIIVLHEE